MIQQLDLDAKLNRFSEGRAELYRLDGVFFCRARAARIGSRNKNAESGSMN